MTNRVKTTATRVFMVRHGVTVLGAEDRFAGATDVALSDEGREQTRRLAERLSDEKIVAVYASPLGRTVETAQILAAPHKLEVQTRDGLREISHGRWEQMTRREVEEKFPEEAAEWEKDPYTFAPVGGESGLAVTARALPALIELVREHPGKPPANPIRYDHSPQDAVCCGGARAHHGSGKEERDKRDPREREKGDRGEAERVEQGRKHCEAKRNNHCTHSAPKPKTHTIVLNLPQSL